MTPYLLVLWSCGSHHTQTLQCQVPNSEVKIILVLGQVFFGAVFMKRTILSSGPFCSWLGACLASAFFLVLHPHPSHPEGLKFLDHCASYQLRAIWVLCGALFLPRAGFSKISLEASGIQIGNLLEWRPEWEHGRAQVLAFEPDPGVRRFFRCLLNETHCFAPKLGEEEKILSKYLKLI